MNTPIVDFVKSYADEDVLRLHMPGHKGKTFLGAEKSDITEISGADVLYNSDGIIKQSEENAKILFNTGKTVYSTEGSSLAIRGMLYLIKKYAKSIGKRPVIAAGRNSHKTFITASALLEIDVEWLLPQNSESMLSCKVTPEYLDSFLSNSVNKPIAVYLTSPDYLGNILDIKEISKVCKKHNILLLVDNAHGAYLNFLENSLHPIHSGADMCCDSAHKTLPVLTGGAYLHISKDTLPFFSKYAELAISFFASTSPSYLILQSLDMANKYLAESYKEQLQLFINEITTLKKYLTSIGYKIIGNEPLKISLATKKYGYTGDSLASILREKGIECEFSDSDYLVLMLTPQIEKKDIAYLKNVLSGIPKKEEINILPPKITKKIKKLSLSDALFSNFEILDIECCLGRICAAPVITCPPAVSIIMCGEEIDSNTIENFKYYGIKKCPVVAP